jgi:hypothetical protein
MNVVFQGGPADGVELAVIGGEPSYLMLMRNPAEDSSMQWLVVGAGFDDHWPGQVRYELRSWIEDERTGEEHATYTYVRT